MKLEKIFFIALILLFATPLYSQNTQIVYLSGRDAANTVELDRLHRLPVSAVGGLLVPGLGLLGGEGEGLVALGSGAGPIHVRYRVRLKSRPVRNNCAYWNTRHLRGLS